MFRRVLGNLALLLGSVVASLLVGEVALHAAGFHPYVPRRPAIRVEPGGVMNGPDPVIGYTYLPGRYTITFDNGDSWVTTHGADTLRATRSADTPPGQRGLWIFGCSFVHGWGLNDAETLPWKVQEKLPKYDVANFGVGGYSTLQSLLQFQRALERRPAPAVVVLAYAGFHDERNTVSRRWLKGTYEYEHLGTTATPYARLEGNGLHFYFRGPEYEGFSIVKASAVAELVDEAYAPVEIRLQNSHHVSELLVLAFAREAAAHGARFLVAGISREPETEHMLDFAREHGLPAVDVSIDLTRWVNRIRWDGHPSGVANDKSAERLTSFLSALGVQ